MFNRKKQTKQQVFNYAKDRLQKLNLSHADGFEPCSGTGDMLIQYHCLNGDRAYYHSESSRTTAAIEAPERFRNRKPYIARRIAPERLTGKDNKYNRPAAAAIPFIPLQVRQLYKSSKACTLALFTEGEVKAAYIAKNFQLPAIAFAGISNYKLNADIKQFLTAKQPPALVLNYDSDGRRADDKSRLASFFGSAFWFCIELVTFYKLQGLTLPKIYICIQNEEQAHKGIDDLLQAVGKQAAAELRTCQTSEYFTFLEVHPDKVYKCLSDFFNYSDGRLKNYTGLLLRADFYSDKESKTRTRLTDVLQANILPPAAIFGKLWNVPTGTGKTTAIIKAAALQKVAFFAPLTGIVDQVYNDAITAGIDAVKYTGNNADRQYLADRLNGLDPQMIVCTYASAKSLCRMLGRITDKFNLVIDEFHSTTAAASPAFMLRQLNGLLDTACNYKTITGLTGTPLLNLHPVTKGLPQVTIKLTGEPKTETEFIQSADPLKAAADAFKESITAGRLPIVLFNNKKDGLTDLLALLKDNADITCFNADNKDNPIFKGLIENGLLGDNVSGLISTTVLEMGINNNTAKDINIIILGNFHPVTIKQFKERNRLAKCHLTIIQKFDPDNAEKAAELQQQYNSLSETDKAGEQGKKLLKTIKALTTTAARYIDRDTEAEKLIRQAERICIALNLCEPESDILDIRTALQNPYIRETAAGFIPDYLAIQNYIFETEKHWLNSSPERLLKALSKYGFEVYNNDKLNIKTDIEERTEEDFEAAQLRRAANKAAKAKLFEEISAELQGTGLPQLTAERSIKAKDTTAQAKEFYQMFLDIRKHCKTDQQALELFTATDGKTARAKLTIQRLKTTRAIFDSHDIGKAPAAILNDFAVGQRFGFNQLKVAFISCLRTDPTIDIEPYDKVKRLDRILKKLRMFFEVDLVGKEKEEYQIKELPKIYN
jgi:hypothetical protein